MATTASVTLRDRFDIDPGKPLPDFDMPQAKAYDCVDRRGAGRQLFALLCRTDLPLRAGAMRALRGVKAQGLMMLVEFGVVDWAPANRRMMVVVYERPMGGRVLPSPNARFEPVAEILFAKKVAKPLHQALNELSQRGVTHRAVRLDNLWWLDAEKEQLVIGDCVTAPPGYDNPPVYEPLHLLMANPDSRGQGYVKDDLYSLGITFIGMLTGREVGQGLNADETIRVKLAQSTYAAFSMEARVPLNLIEVMRGLLMDQEEDRWGLDNLDLWLNGKRLNPAQPRPAKRASRPFWFEGVDYYTTRELAHGLSLKWDAAIAPISDGRLEIWLRRGLEESHIADALVAASNVAMGMPGEPRVVTDFLVARALIILDPIAPMRYRDVRTTMEGFGTALACAMLQHKPYRPFIEIITRDLPKAWINAQGVYSPELSHFEGMFKDTAMSLQSQMIGSGIERCLYELNEHVHCQSSLIEGEMVSDIRELLPALDRVATRIDAGLRPIDRHITAFIGVKWERDTKVQFRALNDTNQERKTLGMISLLAILQWRLGPPVLHGLCAWVGSHVDPIVQSYHGRSRRKELETEVPRLIRKGSLPELYNLLDDQAERASDTEGFAWAKAEYAAAEQQKKQIEAGRLVRDTGAEATGQRAAAMISFAIAVVTFGGMLLLRMF